jgi:hypothetical protein
MPNPEISSVGGMMGNTYGVDADGCIPNLAMKIRTASKTAAYSVLASDSGTHFDNAAAAASVTFTLPTAALGSGCEYWFANVVEAQDIVVAATAGELSAYNDIAANSITLASLPGTYVHVWSNGTKWLSGVGLSKIDIAITVAT